MALLPKVGNIVSSPSLEYRIVVAIAHLATLVATRNSEWDQLSIVAAAHEALDLALELNDRVSAPGGEA